MTNYVDLSTEVSEDIDNPIYPGNNYFKLKTIKSFAKDSFASSNVDMFLHAGTHIDAPRHFDEKGETIEQIPLTRLVGEAVPLDLTAKTEGPISRAEVQAAAKKAAAKGARIRKGSIVILRTDFSRKVKYPDLRWWQIGPFLSKEAAEWLVRKKISAIGYDFAQEAKGEYAKDVPKYTIHRTVLGAGVLQLEVLSNLHKLKGSKFILFAAPVKLKGAEGAPARAVAVEG